MSTVSSVGTGTVNTVNRTDTTGMMLDINRSANDANALPPTELLGADGLPASSVPTLPPSTMTDASEIIAPVLALRIKTGDQQMKDTITGIKGDSEIRKNKATEAAEKTQEAMEKQADAAKNGQAMKILGWVAVALAVVAAIAISVASFGTATAVAALAVAAVVVTMAALNETGQFEKMQGAIEKSLEGPPCNASPDEAKKWALGINMAVQISVAIICAVATFGAGSAGTASQIIQVSANVARGARIASTAAEAAGSATTIAQQGVAIDTAVKQRDAADLQADAMDDKAFIAKIQATMDDEQDRLVQMMQDANAFMGKIVQTVKRQSETTDEITHNMGTARG